MAEYSAKFGQARFGESYFNRIFTREEIDLIISNADQDQSYNTDVLMSMQKTTSVNNDFMTKYIASINEGIEISIGSYELRNNLIDYLLKYSSDINYSMNQLIKELGIDRNQLIDMLMENKDISRSYIIDCIVELALQKHQSIDTLLSNLSLEENIKMDILMYLMKSTNFKIDMNISAIGVTTTINTLIDYMTKNNNLTKPYLISLFSLATNNSMNFIINTLLLKQGTISYPIDFVTLLTTSLNSNISLLKKYSEIGSYGIDMILNVVSLFIDTASVTSSSLFNSTVTNSNLFSTSVSNSNVFNVSASFDAAN